MVCYIGRKYSYRDGYSPIQNQEQETYACIFFIASGFTFAIEAVIAMFLKSYTYHPMIFPQWPMDDLLAGNLFSQFSIVATACLISVMGLSFSGFSFSHCYIRV